MKATDIQTRIKNKAWNYLKNSFYPYRLTSPPLLQNINFSPLHDQRKVIICYLTSSHFFELNDQSKGRTQSFEILTIINIFSTLGFCVDVIGHSDIKVIEYIRNKQYDIIFGFGEAFYQLTNLQPHATSILYMTENHPEFSLREERKRIDYFYARHKKKIEVLRSGLYYRLHHLKKKYSHVITLSEAEPLIQQYEKPYLMFPTGIFNSHFSFGKKNFDTGKKNFLWLGSNGAIHKGLDLLIDIFRKRDDIVLHIGGLSSEEKRLLRWPESNNIIDYGYIDIRSDLFLKIVENCAYIIFPSCSEACATSVTTGMLHGLIPVVMKDAGFNRLGCNAIFLDDFRIEYLEFILNDLSNKSAKELEARSNKVFEFAHHNFSIQAFKQSMQTIISEIINENA